MKNPSMCCAVALALASLGRAANFTVTITNDSGAGSLRQAIADANAAVGADVITFNIPSPGFTLYPASALPVIIDPLTIDGTTQPGYSTAPVVELAGVAAGSGADGLKILTSNCLIRALMINRFSGDGIEIATNGNNVVEGCVIGLDAAGVDRGNSLNGININRSANNRIGGTAAAARNVISGNNGHGVNIMETNSFGNLVLGNFIGTDVTSTADRGNSGDGVEIDDAPNNIVGGTPPGARNIISGNAGEGVVIFTAGATNNLVLGNNIGTDVSGMLSLPNSSHGVYITTSARWNVIGGTNTGAANLIAFNGGDGVYVNSGTNNAVLANRVFANIGLGIDLGTSGVTANDATDADTGANQLQNFPVLTNAALTASSVTIQGSLTSRPTTTYQIDFFANQLCDPAGNGEAQFYIGSTNVTTDGSGVAAVDVTLAMALSGRFIAASATDPLGNTSELSPCVRASSSIAPATFTVVNTNNSGTGSLRQAILESNGRMSSGANLIQFNIPDGGVQTILPAPALPVISEAVVIDGYSQPAATVNTSADAFNANLLVRLDGVNAGADADGFTLAASNSTVRGLVIMRFDGEGIHVISTGNSIVGNVIGLDLDGTDRGNGGSGIFIESSAANTVGGTTPASRNVLSGNGSAGVWIQNLSAAGNIVQGNLIGTDATGTLDRGNSSDGVDINDAPSNIVGGASAAARNVISGNGGEGVTIFTASSTNNSVFGNFIGTDLIGTTALPNGSHGVSITTAARWNMVGGTNSGDGNLIAFNGGDGVFVSAGTNNAVRANRIHSNGGLGIDIGVNGVTTNDVNDADTGANQLQNFPVLTNAVANVGSTLVQGTLNSRASTAYAIDFFSSAACDPSTNGEGQSYLGSASVTTDTSGNAVINVTLPVTISGAFVAATATDPFGNTSEFSPCAFASSTIPPATFTVVNTNDAGPGSLRQAILDSNGRISSNNNVIAFNIPGGGIQTITPLTELPAIGTAVTIDGLTQPGASANTLSNGNNAALRVQLNGVSAGSASSGLVISGSNSVVRGLIIVRFGDWGIELNGARRIRIEGNFIGIDADSSDAGNVLEGIYVNNSAENVIGGLTPAARNVISGNNGQGILIANPPASNNVVQGNFIGTDLTGTLDRGNSADGVLIDDAPGNLVGGTVAGARNLISGNNGEGVEIFTLGATNNAVQGNLIGTDITGLLPLGNSSYGVYLTTSARENLIGGTNAGAGNVIWFNGNDGVFIASGTNNSIRANSIALNGTTSAELGIDLGTSGITTNDVGDADGGANQLQNWPVVTNAVANAANTFVQGTFNSRASETYQLDFFVNVECDTQGNGEGALWLGTDTVTTDASGNAAFSFTLPRRVAGRWITATATDSFGNTSEFSPCHRASSTIPPQTFTVVNTNNSGAGSLRQALLDNNAAPSTGQSVITFNIPGSGVRTIAPPTALAVIIESVLIDGYSQPGASPNSSTGADNAVRLVRLDFAQVPSPESLMLQGHGSTVRGLVIVNSISSGVGLLGNSNVVSGNAISVDDGVVRSFNRGVDVRGTGNRVGGTLPAERNLIDGSSYGIDLSGPTNYVQGNFIGADATGTIGFSNATVGIFLAGDGNVIGGTANGAGNLIAPGDVAAILHDAAGTIIQGNFIGVNITGMASLNPTVPADGILVRNSIGVTIGGAAAGAGNLISGINRNGILFQQGANNGNVIQGNRIGTDATGTLPLGNRFGIQLGAIQLGTASSNLIAGNIIAFNRGEGVIVASVGSTNNSILGNSIFDNNDPNNFGTQERGIRLGGSLPNDPGDGDTGQNQLQNFPELAYATVAGGQTTVRARLNSQPSRVYRIEFFRNPTCDPSGFGEGKTFLGATNVTTDASGNVMWNSTFAVALAAGEVVTATATDPDGNTSEFSACAPVVSPSAVDVRVASSITPTLAALSQTVTNTITMSNIGPATATGVVLTHQLPPGATFVSATASQGSASHSGGVVTANLGSLAPDAVAQVIVQLMLNTVATNRSTATVAAAQSDFLPTNNIAVATNWSGIFDLAASISSSPQPVTAGQTLTLNVAITNLGPDTAAGAHASITVLPTNNVFAPVNHRGLSITVSGGGAFVTPAIPGLPTTINWFLPTLAPGAVATAQITLIPTVPGNYTNRVSVGGPPLPAGLSHDPNGTNNLASAPTTVNAGPGILDLQFSNSAREDDGNAVITVRRVGGTIGTVSAQFSTLPGTATAGSDYTAVTGTVTFTNGQLTQTFSVPLINDGTPECNEFLSLRLSNPAGGAVLVGATNALLDIYDDDQPPPLPSELPVLVFGPLLALFDNSAQLLSADGRVAVFGTESEMVPNDTNDGSDIFARDLILGTTTAVSRNLAGTGTGNDASGDAAMTPDGRFVAFQSYANNLVPNDPMTDPVRVLRHDRLTGQTELVHANTNGSVSSVIPGIVALSANGRFVAFESSDAQIAPGDTNTVTDVFVRDLLLDETTLASAGPSGQSGNAASALVSLSPTAGHLLFFSASTNLVAGAPTNIVTTHYLRDLVNGTTDTLLRNSQGTRLFGTAQTPAFSRDGRTIVFAAIFALAPTDTNVFTDIYVRDVVTNTIRLVSQNAAGNSAGNLQSTDPAISDNGRYVVFMSFASDLAAGDTNGFSDIFRRDLWTGTTELVSRNCPGTGSGNSPSDRPAISADGRFVAFWSRATDLVAADFSGDAAFTRQAYVRDMSLGQTRLVTFNYTGTAPSTDSFFNENELLISADGGTLLFTSDADDLVEDDVTNGADLYAVRLSTVSPSADLSLTMTGAPNPVGVGSNVTYTLIVTNHGPAAATNVVLLHSLPAANFVSANVTQGSFTRTNNTLVANIGSLASGARATLTVVVTATASGTLLSVASVTAYQPDPNPANNFGSVAINAGGGGIGPQPTMTFTISGNNQLELSWPVASSGYSIQETPSLVPPIVWSPSANAITQSGERFRVIVNTSVGQRFFRLAAP